MVSPAGWQIVTAITVLCRGSSRAGTLSHQTIQITEWIIACRKSAAVPLLLLT